MPDLLAAALDYAARGWPVFMLARSKRPVANCPPCTDPGPDHDRDTCPCLTCHGFYAATTDPERVAAIIDAVPRGQLALRTGAASGTVVVDVDPRHGGHHSMAALITEGLLPRTRYAVTGSNGLHLYYQHPGPSVTSRPLPGRHGIDIKADGGYVVLPPSRHQRTGRPYRWANAGHDLTEMAPALLDACQAAPTRTATDPTRSTRTPGGGAISSPDALLASILATVAAAPKGRHRVTLYGAARGVARMVAAGAISHADAIAALTTAGRAAQQTEREIRGAITGGFRDEGVAP
ncbi:bifunctional DNA primase/polymerase [Micromonospora haikouensis]|uniref:bifunctional DNA primase/polymerase n=1 Tax=Micromonospora haikouensis TaxID=686309 RepID=UPI0037B58005